MATNLKNTYLYGNARTGKSGGEDGRYNFYNLFKNDNNSIDDPIFTGFTFDIDTLHSPLFYTGSVDANSVSDTLRMSSVESDDKDSLAVKIEEQLTNIYKLAIIGSPDSYEINSLNAKDIISYMDRHRAGYGLQDMYYMDNVSYGAMDYIYMVDKSAKSMYSNESGVSDLGNGTPNNSIYDDYKEVLEQGNISIDYKVDPNTGTPIVSDTDLSATGESMDDYKNQLKNKLNEKQQKHIDNESKRDELKKKYDAEYEPYENLQKELDELKKNVDNDQSNIKSELSDLQTEVQTLETKLKNNTMDTESMNKVDDCYDVKFADFKNKVSNSEYNDIKLSKPSSFDEKKKSLTDAEKNISSYFEKIWEIEETTITGINRKSSIQSKIDGLNSNIKKKESVLYGIDGNGNPRTEGNPSDDSLYGMYLIAKDETDNDEYSVISRQIDTLDDARDNYEDIIKYDAYSKTKKTITNNFPSMDNDNQSSSSQGQIYEVPQTVYDILGFISGMDRLTHNYPYIMQSITGLDEAYKKYFVSKGDPYMGSGDDKITISCFESLDLRVSSMFNKYLNAAYDRQYRRERLPVNLRRFCCSVFVHDIRNFRNALDKYFNENKNDDVSVGSKIAEIALNCISAVEFKFYDCEIVPEETGSIFDNVANDNAGDMKKTNFTFTYGNCVINFLPFEDMRKYYKTSLEQVSNITPNDKNDKNTQEKTNTYTSENLTKGTEQENEKYKNYTDNLNTSVRNQFNSSSSGDFRMWFDKSSLGNVNNNDYRDYIRKDSSVAVDDYYKTTMVNNFAMNSVVNANKTATDMDEALRRTVVGISASTGLPVGKVVDALDLGFIDPIINEKDKSVSVVKDLGNASNSKILSNGKTEYIGKTNGFEENEPDIIRDLGKI